MIAKMTPPGTKVTTVTTQSATTGSEMNGMTIGDYDARKNAESAVIDD